MAPDSDEVAQYLAHEEGVAVGLPVELVGQRHAGVVESVAGRGLHERDDAGVVEALRGRSSTRRLARGAVPQRLGQRVRAESSASR